MADVPGMAFGTPVEMPVHTYVIEPDFLGPLVDGFKNGRGYYCDFAASVMVNAQTLRLACEAVARTSDRIMLITDFGRELRSLDQRDELDVELDEHEVYTPNWTSEPFLIGGHVEIATDWKGEITEEAADACLAVLVQELLSSGIGQAVIGRRPQTERRRPFAVSTRGRSCTDSARGKQLGRPIIIPDSPYDMELGPAGEPRRFSVRVETDDDQLRQVAVALERASGRMAWLTEFGREIGPEHVAECAEIEVYTPNLGGGIPSFVDGAVDLSIYDPVSVALADACLAVVVQELMAAEVTSATLRRS